MINRKPYQQRFTVPSSWAVKAIGLVIAGAATVIVAMTITRAVSVKSDPPQDGKYVGVRHDAATVPTTAASSSGVTTSGSANTVVRDGVTVVSPQLLVPAIDLAAIQTANGSDDDAVSTKTTRKHSHYAKDSRSSQWKAYGLVFR